jgi:hypothetical protein
LGGIELSLLVYGLGRGIPHQASDLLFLLGLQARRQLQAAEIYSARQIDGRKKIGGRQLERLRKTEKLMDKHTLASAFDVCE